MPVVAEDLLKHAAFVRALAKSLLLDPHAADDVVQETWLTALESPPRHARNLRGWLARVVSRHVFRRARAEARRRTREDAAFRDRAAPPADDSAARAEAQRRLAEAVAALGEPYLEVVLLRYFDGLKPGAIARRVGVPVETVRTRLKRAVALLRERLDSEHGGDRRAWALALAPLLLSDATAAEILGVALRGGLAMSRRKMLAAAAAFALLGVGTLAWIATAGDAAPAHRGVGAPDPSLHAAAPAPPASPPAAGTTYVHRGVVRDQEGRPVEGVRIDAFDALAPRERREAVTDAEGRFAIALPHPADTSFHFLHAEYWGREWDVAFRHEQPTYEVWRGTPVCVTVLDAADEPVAGADVTLSSRAAATVLSDGRTDWIDHPLAWARTGPDGIARLAGPASELIVSARDEERWLGSQCIKVTGPTATTVKLLAGGAIEGRVLDVAGEPVAGARVLAGDCETRTGPDGRYRLERCAPGEVEVRAEAGARGVGGHGLDLGWGHDLPVRVHEGETVRGIDIVLRPGAWIRGRLVDDAGRPLSAIGVCVWTYSNGWFPDARTAVDGGFALGPCGVWEEATLSVFFDSDAYASYDVREFALPSFENMKLAPGGEIDLGTVKGQRRGTVRGRVVEVDGTPARAGGVESLDGRATPILPDGTFDIADVGPGTVTIHALVLGETPRRSENREVVVSTGEVVEGIVLTLGDPLVELRGRVIGKDGAPRERTVACVPHDASPPYSACAHGWTRDGDFALPGLRPGRYLVGLVEQLRPLELVAGREVEVGADGGYVEFVVDEAGAAKVAGRVVDDRDGSPVGSFNADLLRFEWFIPHHADSTWGNGRFDLQANEPGQYAVEIHGQGYAGYRTPAFDLAEGETKDLGTIRLGPAGAIEVVVRDHAGAPVAYAKAYAVSTKLEASFSDFTDADGRVRLDDLNPGTYSLFVVSPQHPIGIVRGLAVASGDVVPAEVHLPAAAPVTILVRDRAGRAVPGATLVYTFPALAPFDSSIAERYEPPGFGSNVADAEGRIRKPFLPTGEVTLTVTAEGSPPATRTIDRGPGEATEVEVVLGR